MGRRGAPWTANLALAAAFALAACAAPEPDAAADARPRPRTVAGTPPVLRVAAEWEPTIGVLVSWPPYLPKDLLIELAHDSKLFVLVPDEAAILGARRWFEEWEIAPESFEFLEVPASDDAAWTRDYGPHPVFTADGRLVLADARYDRSTPDTGLACDAPLQTPWMGAWGPQFLDYDVKNDDAAPTRIAAALGLESLELPIVLTGGNIMTDGRGGALSTCVLTNENRDNGYDETRFREVARTSLGLDRYAVVPNFEDDGIQHVDCLLKMIDERRLLVARPPRDHVLFERYESIVNDHLARLRTSAGEPFEILRLDTARYASERLAAYTNSLVLEDVVYVPLFGIPQDDVALAQWSAALPAHEVKGFPFVLDDEPALPDRARRMYADGIGWRNFDALHCRTRAVWDPGMLHIAVEHEPTMNGGANVFARIVPYSGEGLVADALRLRWRDAAVGGWNDAELMKSTADGVFVSGIPAPPEGGAIEYYVEAADASGRRETAPRFAPAATYRWSGE